MDGFAAAEAVWGRDGDQPVGSRGVASEEDAAFFKQLSDGAGAVGEVVSVAIGAGRSDVAVGGGEVAAGEDVRRGEGGGGAHAVDEEDAV